MTRLSEPAEVQEGKTLNLNQQLSVTTATMGPFALQLLYCYCVYDYSGGNGGWKEMNKENVVENTLCILCCHCQCLCIHSINGCAIENFCHGEVAYVCERGRI